MTRTHFIQHVPFESPGYILTWAQWSGHDCSFSVLSEGDPLPQAEAFDFLVVMGGPMSANDDQRFPWMKEEKKLLVQCFAEKKPMIGICLGAQLMASVLGAKISKAPAKEIGWFPVKSTAEAKISALMPHFPAELAVFHWHGETFELPKGARLLASTDLCPNQAFEYRGHALGLQFHLEVNRENVESMWENCSEDYSGEKFEQKPPALFGEPELYKDTQTVLERALNNLMLPLEAENSSQIGNL